MQFSICEAAFSNPSGAYYATQLSLNCSAQFPILGCNGTILTNIPKFANNFTYINGFTAYAHTSNPLKVPVNELLHPVQVNIQCPYPLVNPDNFDYVVQGNGINGGSCGIPCESITMSPETWRDAHRIHITMNLLSFVMVLFLAVTWSFRYPQIRNSPTYFTCMTILVYHTALIPFWLTDQVRRTGNIQCDSNVQLSQSDACKAESFIMVFLVQIICGYVAHMTLDAFVVVAFNAGMWSKQNRKMFHYCVHAFIWLIAALTIIFLGVDNNAGPDGAYMFCSIKSPVTWSGRFTMIWRDFVSFVVIVLGVANICVLFWAARNMHKRTQVMEQFWKYHRLFVFVAVFTVLTMAGIYPAHLGEANIDNWTAKLNAWVTCAILTPGSCQRPDTLSSQVWLWSMWTGSSLGFAFSIVYFKFQYVKVWASSFSGSRSSDMNRSTSFRGGANNSKPLSKGIRASVETQPPLPDGGALSPVSNPTFDVQPVLVTPTIDQPSDANGSKNPSYFALSHDRLAAESQSGREDVALTQITLEGNINNNDDRTT